MTTDRRLQIDRIYAQALDLGEQQRQAYLDGACADADMRREVDALIKAALTAPGSFDERFDSIREKLWADVLDQGNGSGEDLCGQVIGHWRIGERLARGGLATVYRAFRDDGEFQQTVAFKVLRRGLDTDDVVARFRAERQILSSLDHPAIARIFDGGALPDGRPYLVLEYIDGERITDWCESHQAGVRNRVRLVIDILQALHHAHKHLVVHRDIKPSNILVSSEGHVSLLDFGIAKLLDPDALPGTGTLTRTGVSLLTPGYGSPEQLAGSVVTTASDIYQVGVLLYELLIGQRPAPAASDPMYEPPSRRLKGTRRYAEIRGDLDAILMKAMHIEPTQRYASAIEMEADLERYLDGRAVLAQPATMSYRLRKLIRRKPWLLPGAAIIVLSVATYIITLTLHSAELNRERQRAEAAQDFLVDLLSSPDPFAPADAERGRSITVVEALDIGRARLENDLADEPELQANLMSAVAGVYQSLDQHQPAIELGEKALALNLALHGEQSETVLENLRMLGKLYEASAQVDRAREYIERQLATARNIYGNTDARLSFAEVAAGTFEITQGHLDDGRELLRSGIDRLRVAPEEYAETFIEAVVSEHDGLFDSQELRKPLEEALAVAKAVYGEESVHTANVVLAIARNHVYLGDIERAKENYAVGLRIYDKLLGPMHTNTIAHLNNYGFLLARIKDNVGAEAVHRELSERLEASVGENHRLVADNYQNLASALYRQGRYDEALPLHRKAYEIYGQVLEDDHYIGVFPLLSIAYIELQQQHPAEAEAAADTALQRFRAVVPDSFLEGVATCLVGVAKERQGATVEGAAMVEASHAMLDPSNLEGSPYLELCRYPD